MTLPTGTATFALQPAGGESFIIETPTDNLTIELPEILFARIDAYLDATALTPQGETGELMFRYDLPNLLIPKGRTLFFQQGEVVKLPDPAQASSSNGLNNWISQLRALAPLVPGGLFLQVLPSVPTAALQNVSAHTLEQLPSSAAATSPAPSEWDHWVSSRV